MKEDKEHKKDCAVEDQSFAESARLSDILYHDVGLNDNYIAEIFEDIFGEICKNKPWLNGSDKNK
jgi:hypothetical protein